MSARDVRREIEQADFDLRAAREELAALDARLAAELAQRPARRVALEAQLTALASALADCAEQTRALTHERETLQQQVRAGRSVVGRHTARSAPAWDPSNDTRLRDVVKPRGWRKGQPWYTRLFWWAFDVKEWK